tara:strand:+ start:457 stop:738 length:282 start_codon:yes stop_codon:yes gene_type:complete
MAIPRATDANPTGIDATGGDIIGKASTSKVGFYGTTPVAQRSGADGGAVSTQAITPGNTTAISAIVVARVAELEVLANELRAGIVALGLHAGA